MTAPDLRPQAHFAFFHAPWCGVCHDKAPLVEDFAKQYGLELDRFDIETADGKAEYERRGVKQVPTLALVRGERMPFRLIGAMITPENVAHLMRMHAPPATTPQPPAGDPAA